MGTPNASRIEVKEQAYTFVETRLAFILKEIDSRLNCAEVYHTVTYTSDLISKVEIFSNSLRTNKVMERTFSRTTGSDGVEYITGMITIFYNTDSSEDSRVTTTITRDVNDRITECDNVFSTGETIPCL